MEIEQVQREILAARGLSPEAIEQLVHLSFEPSSVHVDTPLTNVAVGFRNREYIADEVLPVVPVAKPSDKYFVYNTNNFFSEPQTAQLSSEAMPGRIRYQVSTSNYSCVDYGLMDFVGAKEEAAADAPIIPRTYATEMVSNMQLLLRERRVAAVVFGSGNYGTSTSALSGSNQWDQAASDPVQAIDDAIETPLARPNIMVIGVQAWNKLRNHPKLKELILARAATADGATPLRMTEQAVAAAFGLDAVYVGRSKFVNTVEGQTSTSAYVWGKSCALLRRTPPNPRNTDCFGVTFRLQAPQIQVIDAPLLGLAGGVYIKHTMSETEVATGAGSAGYLYTTVVS